MRRIYAISYRARAWAAGAAYEKDVQDLTGLYR